MSELKQAVERLAQALWPTVLHEDIETLDVQTVLSALAKAVGVEGE